MTLLSSETIHVSTVAIKGRAVLIAGPSGAGKSDLALRLIDRGATLVSDDYTVVRREGTRLLASAPATIAGRMEVRGIGLIEMPHEDDAPVALMVALDDAVDRLPDIDRTRMVVGIEVPVIALAPFETSAAIKVELALARLP